MRNASSRTYVIILAAVVLVGAMLVAISLQPPARRNTLTFGPGATVHGVSQGDWSARHWQWTLSSPLDNNPGLDASGAFCADGQSGPVFFLPRNLAPCTIPSGTAILVPVTGTECSTTEPAPFSGTSEEELRACAALELERYVNISVSVDGETVPDIEAYRLASPLFPVILPERNVLGAPAGPSYAVAEGYQVILRPLPPGEHDIAVHLELADGTVLPDKLARVTVVEPVWTAPLSTPVPATPVIATPVSP
jgi:hypothetical protein